MILLIIILILIWVLIFIILGAYLQVKYNLIKREDKKIIITSEIEEKIKNIDNYNEKLEKTVVILSQKIKKNTEEKTDDFF